MDLEISGPLALLSIRTGKANAIGPAFLDRLSSQLDVLERSGARALVVTGEGKAFSAGLDLPQLITLDLPGLQRFIRRFSEVMLRVFQLPIPVVAAVNGHAIAGGCVLALQADVRLGARGDLRMGLNEVQLGLGLPAVILETLRWQVPPQSLLPIALEGRLVGSEEAVQLGLLHAVVPPETLLEAARARAAAMAALPGPAFRDIKQAVRAPVLAAIRALEADDARRWTETAFSPEARARLAEVVSRLGRK
jgi:Delta3-Delta2-enoyl-CoA isomerase